MHPTPTLERVLKTIALTHYQGQLCRAVNADALYGFSRAGHYVPRPLYNLGPPKGGARFTPRGGMPCLYLAEDYETSLREYLQVGSPARLRTTVRNTTFVNYVADVRLEKVLDLTIRCGTQNLRNYSHGTEKPLAVSEGSPDTAHSSIGSCRS